MRAPLCSFVDMVGTKMIAKSLLLSGLRMIGRNFSMNSGAKEIIYFNHQDQNQQRDLKTVDSVRSSFGWKGMVCAVLEKQLRRSIYKIDRKRSTLESKKIYPCHV